MIVPPIILKAATLTGIPAMKKSDLNACLKNAYLAVGKWWLREALPKHFEAGAAERYGYGPRSTRHLRRKKARFHHTQPLLFTKTFMRQVISPGRQHLVVTKHGVEIKLRHDARHRTVHQDIVRLARDGSDLEKASEIFAAAFAEALERVEARKTIRAG